MGLHALLWTLVERGTLSVTLSLTLAEAVAASRDLEAPLWWAGWIATLPPWEERTPGED
ncbi:hypothetical protein WMF31_17695 [Sorangium sp. So ce1036]|uniref:hypothetical protein n=1 Tax=Sorangium sp. So ce1036 TaxID=3133328 RepID=UPI003EFD34C5